MVFFLLLLYLEFILGNVDQAGAGNIFIMVYYQINEKDFQPILIPIQIKPLPSNHISIELSPSKVGTYRIYIAYRNIPINGKLSLNKNKKLLFIDKLYVYRTFDYIYDEKNSLTNSKIEEFYIYVYK